jgi:atypical dual specificity phosphatase
LDGALIGSEHPENLERDMSGKLEVTRIIAERLASQGFRTVINLTERPWTYGVAALAVQQLPMSDRHIEQTTRATLDSAVRLIEQGISAGHGVWVHCQGGIDRTGCVIACYLTSRGLTAEAAIDAIKERWPERRRARSISHELWEPVADRIRAYASRADAGDGSR